VQWKNLKKNIQKVEEKKEKNYVVADLNTVENRKILKK